MRIAPGPTTAYEVLRRWASMGMVRRGILVHDKLEKQEWCVPYRVVMAIQRFAFEFRIQVEQVAIAFEDSWDNSRRVHTDRIEAMDSAEEAIQIVGKHSGACMVRTSVLSACSAAPGKMQVQVVPWSKTSGLRSSSLILRIA